MIWETYMLYKKKTLSKIRHSKPTLIRSSTSALRQLRFSVPIDQVMNQVMNTITSEFPNGCAMRMLAADGTEQVVQHQQPQTYLQCSPPRPPEDLGLSSDQCPICLQPCPYEGNHQRSCLVSCGHVYGMSCIIRWIEHKTTNAKCPQCNKKFKLKDVRKIYASPSDDQVSVQRIKELEAEVVSLRASKAALIDMVNLDGYTFNAQQIEIKALKAMLPKQRGIETLYEKKETSYKSC